MDFLKSIWTLLFSRQSDVHKEQKNEKKVFKDSTVVRLDQIHYQP
jgi:hypothetical protein